MIAVKKTILIFTVILCLCFTAISASALSETTVGDISFSLSENYKISTVKNLENKNDVEGLVFVAISEDGEHQIQCRAAETVFSKELGDFSKLDREAVKPIGEKLFSDGFEAVTTPYAVFLKSNVTADDSSVVYVTVSSGLLYTFSYFGNDPTRIGEFITTVKLPSSVKNKHEKVTAVIIIVTVMTAFAVVLFFLGASFIRDYKRYKIEQSENIVSQYIKIKRRRY